MQFLLNFKWRKFNAQHGCPPLKFGEARFCLLDLKPALPCDPDAIRGGLLCINTPRSWRVMSYCGGFVKAFFKKIRRSTGSMSASMAGP